MGWSQKQQEHARRYGQVLFRWVLVLVGAGCCGLLVSELIVRSGLAAARPAVVVIAITAVFACINDVVQMMRSAAAYIEEAVSGAPTVTLESLTQGFWKAWSGLTPIVVVFLAYVPVVPMPEPASPWYVVYAPPRDERAVRPLAMVPVFYREDAHEDDWSSGTSFGRADVDTSREGFGRIVEGWRVCGSQGVPVRLRITGFSSSKPFRHRSAGESEALNAKAANLRAWSAVCYLAERAPVVLVDELGSGRLISEERLAEWVADEEFERCMEAGSSEGPAAIEVELTRWEHSRAGYAAMRTERLLEDRPRWIQVRDEKDALEALSRRVQFEVIGKGACELPVVEEEGKLCTAAIQTP